MSLTSVFGMGTGGSSPPLSPEWLYYGKIPLYMNFGFYEAWQLHSRERNWVFKGFITLVQNVAYLCFDSLICSYLKSLRSSPRPISIGQLNTLLRLHLRPINLVVCKGSYSFAGISYLEVSFTLRCFQRLSHPHFATLLCRWRDNRCTIGAFIPVLSY